MKIRHFILFSILLLFTGATATAQKQGQQLIDSLLNELPKTGKDTTKVNILTALSVADMTINTTEGVKYGNMGLDLALQLRWPKGILNAYTAIGFNYEKAQNYSMALASYNKCIEAATSYGDQNNVARAWSNIGNVYLDQDNFDEVLKNYSKSLGIYQELKDNDNIARMLGNFGVVYSNKGDKVQSHNYYLQALTVYKEIKNKTGIATIEIRLGVDDQNRGNYASAIAHYSTAYKLYDELHNKGEMALAMRNIGATYQNQNKFKNALEYYDISLKIYESLGRKVDVARLSGNIAAVYTAQFKYPEALEVNFKMLKMYEELDNKKELAGTLESIGNTYMSLNNVSQALEYHFKELKLNEALNDSILIANNFLSIGNDYSSGRKYNKALDYSLKALKLYKAKCAKVGIASALINIGNTYYLLGNYPEALAYNFTALKMDEVQNNISNVIILTGNNGECYLGIAKDTSGRIKADSLVSPGRQANLSKAVKYLTKAVQLAKENQMLDIVIECSGYLAEAQALTGDYKSALENYKVSVILKDSIFSQQNSLKIAEMEAGRASEVKDKQIQIDQLAISKARSQRWYFYIGISLLLLIIAIVMKSYSTQKHTNKLLGAEKGKSEKLLADLQTKNREITDNIDYAQRIQSAILPDVKQIYRVFPQSFILYLPKDIVSGDFYGFAETEERALIIAGDCTGHGVSGAFMSMIGGTLLNQIINERHIEDPAIILNQLNAAVIETFHQSENESNDGMDISMCSFDLGKRQLIYAGANRPLWLVRNNEIITYKPDKFPIGGLQAARDRTFTNHIIQLQKNDTVYIFTDGYADQFGGEKGKKLMTAKFKEIIISIQHMDMHRQQEYLKEFFYSWKNMNEQVDDVLVIGVRV